MNTELHYTDPKDTNFSLYIDIDDNGNGEEVLVIETKGDEISFLVLDDEDNALYSISFPYEHFMDFIEAADFQKAMLSRAKELHDAVQRHPASQPRLQIIDGGGNQ